MRGMGMARETAEARRLVQAAVVAMGVGALVLYGSGVAPGLLGGDAGEFQMAAWLAGVAHPTGYPLYLLVGWLWSHALAPFGVSPATAMNWLSVLCAAATVGGVVGATEALAGRLLPGLSERVRLWAGIGAAAWVAVSPTFWSQALLAEVYALNALFVVTLLWMALRRLPLPWLALVYGLSLTHHRTMILWLPALLLFLWQDGQLQRGRRRLWAALGLLLLPQLLYLYIPLRGPVTPYLHQPLAPGQALNLYDGSLSAFWNNISGRVFGADLAVREGWGARLALVADLWQENALGFAALAALLSFPLARQANWRPALLVLGGAAAIIAFGAIYAIGDVEVMFIPAWMALIMWTLCWVAWLGSRVLSGWLALPLVALLALGLVPARWEELSMRQAEARQGWAKRLEAAPQDAILVSNDRNEMVALWYLQFVEGRRRDLLGLFPLITERPEHREVEGIVALALGTGRPVRLIKAMPGLALRYEVAPAEAEMVAVQGLAAPLDATTMTPAHPLGINGWSASGRQLVTGETLTVTLGWTVGAPLPAGVSSYVHLVGADGAVAAQHDHDPGGAFFPSNRWPVGEGLRDEHPIPLPESLPPGLYDLHAGAYRSTEDGLEPIAPDQVLGRVLLLPERAPTESLALAPGAVTATLGAPPVVALQAALMDGVREIQPGALLQVGFNFEVIQGPGLPLKLFLHLVRQGEPRPVAQSDGEPWIPTDLWQAGERLSEVVPLPLGPEIAPGRYQVLAGFYNPEDGTRLPVVGGGDTIVIGEVEVTP